ncbi:FUSC family protein [Raineyella fluvialis]|uniref:Integral membrane bound transporter domain-containing protein n=1 Tax=Raineyella fluvialis TaxID=2662261 RepID=A0A5Q2FFW7_9ACTN|nr:FUSC family protein [Raineyella fluvialis]QGF23186.1 hypothetical protein Rai3103_05375 [Raineyella fluvialis]
MSHPSSAGRPTSSSLRRTPRLVLAYVRSTARAGWLRVRGAVVPNTQSAVFATASWLICRYLIGDPSPIFAPIATFLCLGFTRNREPRKVIEVGIGATIGVLLGEVVVAAIGFGWWQLGLVLLTTPLLGRFLDRSDLMTFQTAINTMVVGSMSLVAATARAPGAVSAPFGRWVDALVGVAVALVAAAVLPQSLTSRPRRYTASALAGLARALDSIAEGMTDGDVRKVAEAYADLSVARNQVGDGQTARHSAADMARLNPARRADRHQLAELDRLLRLSDRLNGTLFVLARQAAGIVGESGRQPAVAELASDAAASLHDLARQIGHWEKPIRARETALMMAARLSPDDIDTSTGWRTTALVSLLRAVAVDLLQLTGLSLPQARAALPDIGRLDPGSGSDDVIAMPEEAPSNLWGTSTFPVIPEHPPSRRRPKDSPHQDTPDDEGSG